ncbi:DNA cytosine methyltransferase [Kitasatospora aureofaciens]|uniref:DNA cytosine methyltransferase n=1 Tax=Kitasatospora aureofaciens TaxID=1894 RepID=UPI0033DD217C
MVDQPKFEEKARTSVELFAGGGGLAMAVHQAGFRPLLFNEWDKRACETLEDNLKPLGAVRFQAGTEFEKAPAPGESWPLVAGDIRDLKLGHLSGRVDVIAGGPPCQPFSLGGVAKGDEDKRNMFPFMFKAIREIQPKAVICENVRGLLRKSFEPYFEYIQNELRLPFEKRDDERPWDEHNRALVKRLASGGVPASERYEVIKVPVNAADYGVPQIRQRVILVAFRADLGVDIEKFEKFVNTPQFSVDALWRSIRDGEYWERHSYVDEHVIERVKKMLPKDIKDDDLKPWRTLRDAIRGFGTDEVLPPLPEVPLGKLDRKTEIDNIPDHVGWPDARIYPGHTPNELDKPAKTVKAGVHGVPGGESVMLLDKWVKDASEPDGRRYLHRYMTVRETARVMTFPDTWRLAGPRGEKMRQLGNAVPVSLGKFFADAVANALSEAGH